MIEELSPVELQIIKGLLSTKTDQEIADIMEVPAEVIHSFISELTSGTEERNEQINKIIESRLLSEKNVTRKSQVEKEQVVKEKEKRKQQKESNLREVERIKRSRMRESSRKYKTIDQDLSKMISVKIDSKTTVFVKPGTDIEKIKKQYGRQPN